MAFIRGCSWLSFRVTFSTSCGCSVFSTSCMHGTKAIHMQGASLMLCDSSKSRKKRRGGCGLTHKQPISTFSLSNSPFPLRIFSRKVAATPTYRQLPILPGGWLPICAFLAPTCLGANLQPRGKYHREPKSWCPGTTSRDRAKLPPNSGSKWETIGISPRDSPELRSASVHQ